MVEIKAETGARISEVIKAKRRDVGKLTWTGIKKGKRRVSLPVRPWLQAAASAAPTPTAPLCPNAKGKHWSYWTFRDWFKRACTECGLTGVSPHSLRHSRATWYVEAGMSFRAVQELLGHKNAVSTMRYFEGAQAAREIDDASVPTRDPVCHMRDKSGSVRVVRAKNGTVRKGASKSTNSATRRRSVRKSKQSK